MCAPFHETARNGSNDNKAVSSLNKPKGLDGSRRLMRELASSGAAFGWKDRRQLRLEIKTVLICESRDVCPKHCSQLAQCNEE